LIALEQAARSTLIQRQTRWSASAESDLIRGVEEYR
jgi:hypothetical protein